MQESKGLFVFELFIFSAFQLVVMYSFHEWSITLESGVSSLSQGLKGWLVGETNERTNRNKDLILHQWPTFKIQSCGLEIKVTFLNRRYLSLIFLNSLRFHNELQLFSTEKYWKFIFLPSPYLFIYSGDGTNTEIIKFEVYSFSG